MKRTHTSLWSAAILGIALTLGGCAHRHHSTQVVGAVAGGVLGNALFGTTLGTIGGATAGALVGNHLSQSAPPPKRGPRPGHHHRHR